MKMLIITILILIFSSCKQNKLNDNYEFIDSIGNRIYISKSKYAIIFVNKYVCIDCLIELYWYLIDNKLYSNEQIFLLIKTDNNIVARLSVEKKINSYLGREAICIFEKEIFKDDIASLFTTKKINDTPAINLNSDGYEFIMYYKEIFDRNGNLKNDFKIKINRMNNHY